MGRSTNAAEYIRSIPQDGEEKEQGKELNGNIN